MADKDNTIEQSVPGRPSGTDEQFAVSGGLNVKAGDRFSDYILESELGAGGMGTVWKARHFRDSDTAIYVVKFVSAQIEQTEYMFQRFKNEIQTIKQIRHTNIIPIRAWDWDSRPPFYVMDFIGSEDGKPQNLADFISAGEIPIDKIIKWTRQAASALETAHGQGVIHRDIKPANILIDVQDNVLVCDFGIAKTDDSQSSGTQVSPRTATGGFVGTSSYASPEQKKDSKNVNHQTDIFSLGYVLYEMLTGEHVFNTGGSSPRTVRDDISPQLEEVYYKMVNPKLDKRFQTMREVIEALDNLRPPLPLPRNQLRPEWNR